MECVAAGRATCPGRPPAPEERADPEVLEVLEGPAVVEASAPATRCRPGDQVDHREGLREGRPGGQADRWEDRCWNSYRTHGFQDHPSCSEEALGSFLGHPSPAGGRKSTKLANSQTSTSFHNSTAGGNLTYLITKLRVGHVVRYRPAGVWAGSHAITLGWLLTAAWSVVLVRTVLHVPLRSRAVAASLRVLLALLRRVGWHLLGVGWHAWVGAHLVAVHVRRGRQRLLVSACNTT